MSGKNRSFSSEFGASVAERNSPATDGFSSYAICHKRATARSFAEDNEVVQTLAANRVNEPFHVSSLPLTWL